MEKYKTPFDLMNTQLEKALDLKTKQQTAQNELQNSLLLAKVKANYDQMSSLSLAKQKSELETKQKFDVFDEYNKRYGQSNPGSVRMGSSGKMETLNIKDQILNKIQRGEQLTPGELQIYNDTMKRGSQRGITTDPATTKQFRDNIFKHLESGNEAEITADLNDLKTNWSKYKEAGVDVSSIMKEIINRPEQKTSPKKTIWNTVGEAFRQLVMGG